MDDYSISGCINEAKEIEKKYIQLLNKTENSLYETCNINKEAKSLQREVLTRYEIWFEVTQRIVSQYSDDYETFKKQYPFVRSLIYLSRPSDKGNERRNLEFGFMDFFDIQVNILHTIEPIIEMQKTNFKKLITADLIESELDQSEWLYEHDFIRAAGIITGIILERYLKTLCEINNIEYSEKDTIDPLVTKIYTSEKIAGFDITLLKSIQHLASIRNKCCHDAEDPKKHDVRELLDKVKKITYLGL